LLVAGAGFEPATFRL